MIAPTVPIRVLLVGSREFSPSVVAELERAGCETVPAPTLGVALDLLARLKFHCVLLGESAHHEGLPQALRAVHRAEPRAAIVAVDPEIEAAAAVLALRSGAADILSGDIAAEAVAASVRAALERQAERVRQEAAFAALRDEVARLSGVLQQEQERTRRLTVATLESLVCVLEAKDEWLGGHSLRVAELAASLAAEQGRSDAEVELIRLAGRVHDIGMIGVGSDIISKQGPLSPEEFDQVKRHVVVGSQILAPLPHLSQVGLFVRHHHERWDGTGYPDGLAGDAVPWGAQLIAAAEIYDALTTTRPYREPLVPADAVRQMERLVDAAISPATHRLLGAVVDRRRALVFLEQPQPAGASAAALRESELSAFVTPGEGLSGRTGRNFPSH